MVTEYPLVKGDRHRTYIEYPCVDCGRERLVQYMVAEKRPKNLRCHKCANKLNNPHQNRIRHTEGYVQVWVGHDDFFYPMANKSSYVLEHRLVMAKHLARLLLPWEVVHHKNGDKTDNRLGNLSLFPSHSYHAPDSLLRKRCATLEKRVTMLEAEIIILKKELEDARNRTYNS